MLLSSSLEGLLVLSVLPLFWTEQYNEKSLLFIHILVFVCGFGQAEIALLGVQIIVLSSYFELDVSFKSTAFFSPDQKLCN